MMVSVTQHIIHAPEVGQDSILLAGWQPVVRELAARATVTNRRAAYQATPRRTRTVHILCRTTLERRKAAWS
jgi:hypothetical protein